MAMALCHVLFFGRLSTKLVLIQLIAAHTHTKTIEWNKQKPKKNVTLYGKKEDVNSKRCVQLHPVYEYIVYSVRKRRRSMACIA